MSAFVVNKQHIDALVNACINGPSRTVCPGGYWHNVLPYYIDEHDPEAASKLGRLLWLENVKSVSHRYNTDTDLPGPTGFTISEAEEYKFDAIHTHRIPTVAVIKAIDCFEYQSCEHHGWKSSDTASLMQQLRQRCSHFLPGYDDAAWEIA